MNTSPWDLRDLVVDTVSDEVGRLTFAVPIDPSATTRYRVVLSPDVGDDDGLRELVHEFTVDAQRVFDHDLARALAPDADGNGRLDAVVRVDGVTVHGEVSGAARAEQFTIRPTAWIQAGAEVDVQVRHDGRSVGRCSFTTVACVEEPPPSVEVTVPDASRGGTHHSSIDAGLGAGLGSGFADGTFRPEESVTRAQMATFLFRALLL